MAASTLTAPDGHAAGRVTIVTTLTSLIPPVGVSAVLILCVVLEILSPEVGGVAILTVLGLGAATTGTVFTTAKRTPTDQYATLERVVPVAAPDPVAQEAAAAEAELPEPEGRHAAPVIHDDGGAA